MKLFLFLIIALLSCKSQLVRKATDSGIQSNYKVILTEREFFNMGMTGSLDGNSYSYRFHDSTYEKFIHVHMGGSHNTYMWESGNYEVQNLTLVLWPIVKFQCSIKGLAEYMPCSYGDMTDYFYVNKDTLSESEVQTLKFLPRESQIYFNERGMSFMDYEVAGFSRMYEFVR